MADWVIIADDDSADLHTAAKALESSGIRVTALGSGKALLDYLHKNEEPDLILMGQMMRGMDGFETLEKLRAQEKGGRQTPVIFLSSDANQESEAIGLRLGATDFIRKPFDPDVLVSRVENVIRTQEKLEQFEKDVNTDQMTGLLNKISAEDRLRAKCREDQGFLCVMDLDSFKLINDLYGHDTGDKALVQFSALMRRCLRSEDICGRIGGDEFVLFAQNMRTEQELSKFCKRINKEFTKIMEETLGAPLKIPLGVSIGAAQVPANGREYDKLFHLADQALLTVKLNGKHGCAVAGGVQANLQDSSGELNLEAVTMILEERNITSSAMWMGKEAFINIYRYMMRYMERYHGVAYRVLYTLTVSGPDCSQEDRNIINGKFRAMVQSSLRNSDVMVEVSENQIFLLLPEMQESNIHVVTDRLMAKWNASDVAGRAEITWETGKVQLGDSEDKGEQKGKDRVVIADSDRASRREAEKVLTGGGMLVTALESGLSLLNYLRDYQPDVILLDVTRADSDGLETLRTLRSLNWQSTETPVILIADGKSRYAAEKGLALGADDVIMRPYIPELLRRRVERTVELNRLRATLSESGNRRN